MKSMAERLSISIPLVAGLLSCAGPAGAQAMNTYWAKIGAWNMGTTETKSVGSAGILPANVVAITVIIHSDPVTVNGTPRVEVDRFERTGFGEVAQEVNPTNYMGRGGIFEMTPSGSLLLYRGPNVEMATQRNRFLQGLHASSTANRGWVRIDYVGTPINASQPFAIKTKVLTTGSWNMSTVRSLNVNMTNLGSPANRISSFAVTVNSDDLVVSSDLTRTGPSGSFGGSAVISDKVSPPIAALRIDEHTGYFNGNDWGWNFIGSGNRGFVKVDYVAAECNEGTGYTRSFIGYTANGADCHGNYGSGASAVHVVQTQGADIWNGSDKFAFIHKAQSAANLTIKARVDRIENTNAWARAGIMLRAGLGANSRHVAMVVTPKPASGNGNGIGFTVRTTDGGTTSESSPNTFSAPYWVLLQKTGNTFKGYISTTGTGNPTTNPGSWTQVGSTATVSFPGNYYAGLCQTAGNNSPALHNTSVYSNVSF